MSTLIKSIRGYALLLRLVSLIVGCLILLTAPTASQPKPGKLPGNPQAYHLQAGEPKPRWSVSIQATAIPVATSNTLLVKGSDDLTVLDRTNGRTLWQAKGYFVGITTTPRQPQVAVLLTSQAELVGRELRTGRQLWHSALPLDYPQSAGSELYNHLIWQPLDVYGETIILRRRDRWTDARFRNARTGAVLDRARSRDLAVLRASAALHNKRHVHWDMLRDGWTIRLDPNGRTPIALTPPALRGGDEDFLGRVGNRFVWLEIGDDGETGHSSLPNYIVCFDVNGDELWRFPKWITDTTKLGMPEIQLKSINGGIMDPLGRAVLAQDYRGWVYALNVKTGKPLGSPLTKSSGYYMAHQLPYRCGYIDYDEEAGQLRYRDGRTAKLIKAVPLKLGKWVHLLYAGSDFCLSVAKGKQLQLICYDEQILLRK